MFTYLHTQDLHVDMNMWAISINYKKAKGKYKNNIVIFAVLAYVFKVLNFTEQVAYVL